MDIRQLKYFVAVAEELSMSAAARRLHISQPPLSRSIQALEASLGVQLFDRVRGKLGLTNAGRALLEKSGAALQQFSNALEGARAAGRNDGDALRIGYMALGLLHPSPVAAVRRLRERMPESKVVLAQLTPRAQLEGIAEGRIHVGLVYRQEGGTSVARIEAFDEGVSVVMPTSHKLVKKRVLRIEDLVHEPIVWMSRDSSPAFYDAFSASFEAQGLRLNVQERVDSLPMALALVASGAGISFAPASARWGWSDSVVTRPTAGLGARFQTDWIWRQGGELPPLSEFLHILRILRQLPRAVTRA